MPKKLFFTIFLLLASCATEAGYQKKLAAFNGTSEAELTKSWGKPDKTENLGGSRILTYTKSRQVEVSGAHTNYQSINVGSGSYAIPTGTSAPVYAEYVCETKFEIVKGKVAGAKFNGNDCVAGE